ncbi:MAG: SRPBCC family protein [Gammaproteobacteria bacterium]
MKVFASVVINSEADRVWEILRDFVGLTTWSNVVTRAEITNGKLSDQPGAVRVLEVADGGRFVETLISLSDQCRSLQYDIVESPLPVSNYVATMQVWPVSIGNLSFVTWQAEFDVSNDDADAMREIVGERICTDGLIALRDFCERSGGN